MKTFVKLVLPSALLLPFADEGSAQVVNKYDIPDWANFAKYEEANQAAPEGAVVFMGDSVTEGWALEHPDFFKENGYLCRGISGQTTSQMLVRFRADVIALKPRAVVILAGINDIAQNTGYIAVENTFGNIVSMSEIALANGVRPILCAVPPAQSIPWNPKIEAPAELVIRLNGMLREYAETQGLPYVDYASALQDEHGGVSKSYAPDEIHPASEGYRVMETVVQPVIEKLTAPSAE
ncbi:hypothetical protein AXK12_06975 [Cephaloticoccus capnophilus]|uniref:SGNH hydrolase-type esterase domain-containing protein n=1 Tax=Cephaloticoccus capnophilus TaxID=1548208 RepID=A0A139SJR4_9BACT|nr:SGNH/GDSL hydrolase family protein [Cephaloticoccus capnophilus]KXU34763.1 hypothetical protein AXK12_06975 [Cephaloticoccus capnophilus]